MCAGNLSPQVKERRILPILLANTITKKGFFWTLEPVQCLNTTIQFQKPLSKIMIWFRLKRDQLAIHLHFQDIWSTLDLENSCLMWKEVKPLFTLFESKYQCQQRWHNSPLTQCQCYIVLWPPPPASCPIHSAPSTLLTTCPRTHKIRQSARRPTLLCLWRVAGAAGGCGWGGHKCGNLLLQRLPAMLREWIQAHGLGFGGHAVGLLLLNWSRRLFCGAKLLYRVVCSLIFMSIWPLNVSSQGQVQDVQTLCGLSGFGWDKGSRWWFPPSSMDKLFQVSQLSLMCIIPANYFIWRFS